MWFVSKIISIKSHEIWNSEKKNYGNLNIFPYFNLLFQMLPFPVFHLLGIMESRYLQHCFGFVHHISHIFYYFNLIIYALYETKTTMWISLILCELKCEFTRHKTIVTWDFTMFIPPQTRGVHRFGSVEIELGKLKL